MSRSRTFRVMWCCQLDSTIPSSYPPCPSISRTLVEEVSPPSQLAVRMSDAHTVTPDFLEKEVLLPFTKADPFMPGAGLGLGLAQRMVEILGGKLAIASTLYKGTIVHVEVPLHLLNQDNESDEEELEESSNGAGRGSSRPHSPVRQDGIFLAGFDGKDRGTRRVGKSLLRTLKLRFCRVVTGINYASLIVAPEGVTEVRLADLARQARPGVHIIILGKENASRSNLPDTPTLTPSSAQAAAQDYLQRIPTTYLTRPLRPSLISQIVKPADAEPPIRETFVSDVVGGHDARLSPVTRAGETTPGSARPTRPNLARGDSVSTLRPSSSAITFDSEILPSSANPPRPDTRSSSIRMPGSAIPDGDASGADMRDGVLPKDDTPVGNSKESHFLPSLRPAPHEQASDPFPALAGPLGWSDSSDSMDSAGAASRWPELKEAKSMPAVQETTQDDPLRGEQSSSISR